MTPDRNLPWLTLGAVLVFAAAAVYATPLLHNFGRRRRLKPPPRSILVAFRVWFAVLAGAALWLLLTGRNGLLAGFGAR